MISSSVSVKAPSSTANLGPGFDVFGMALDAFYDIVTLKEMDQKGIKIINDDSNVIDNKNSHVSYPVPIDSEKNTASIVIRNMLKKFKIQKGIQIKIKKGVPVGFGMGSSAASAAAAAMAFNELFDLKLDLNSLVEFAGMGEQASAGSIHYDNVASSVVGGFVIVKTDPLNVIKIEPPKDLTLCVAIPKIQVPQKKTKVSRSVIPKKIMLNDHIKNVSNAATIVAGFAKKDSILIGRSVQDVIVEPVRKHMIPGFDVVKKNALKAGALGVTISGAGPSIIAFSTKSTDNERIASYMRKGFLTCKTDCQVVICKPSKGAMVIKKG